MSMNKKGGGSDQAGEKAAGKKQTSRAAANPRSKNSKGSWDPELLSKLAVQILGLDPKGISFPQHPSFPVAQPKLDQKFFHALKRAELLLNAAAGETDENIHAYQLFREGQGHLTFEEIARRFEEVGWKKLTSRNSVETCIEELAHAAEQVVLNYLSFAMRQQLLVRRAPASISDLKLRLRRYIRSLLRRTLLGNVLRSPDLVSDRVAQYLIAQIEREVPLDGPGTAQEESEAYLGYTSFEDFAFEPPTFRAFLGTSSRPCLTPELFLAAIFYFRTSAARKRCVSASAHQIDELRRTFVTSGAIHESVGANLAQLVGLVAENDRSAKSERAQWELSSRIATELEGSIAPWLRQKLLTHHANSLKERVIRLRSPGPIKDPNSPTPKAAIEHLIDAIAAAQNVVQGDLDEQLIALHSAIDQALHACQETGEELLQQLIELRATLASPPRPPSLSPKNLRATIREFFAGTPPSRVDRKVRPYEVFLFAAQYKQFSDKLVRLRKDLNADFVPNPPHQSSLSVLAYHRGNPIYSEAGEESE